MVVQLKYQLVKQLFNVDLKQNILGAAQELYALEGDVGLSMRRIAAECEVTAAMIYYHYKDKQALYEAVLIHSYQQLELPDPVDYMKFEDWWDTVVEIYFAGWLGMRCLVRAWMESDDAAFRLPMESSDLRYWVDKQMLNEQRADKLTAVMVAGMVMATDAFDWRRRVIEVGEWVVSQRKVDEAPRLKMMKLG